jgi:hypothetical protein
MIEVLAQPKPTEVPRISRPHGLLHKYKASKEMLGSNKSKYETGRKKPSKMKPQKRSCSESSKRLRSSIKN